MCDMIPRTHFSSQKVAIPVEDLKKFKKLKPIGVIDVDYKRRTIVSVDRSNRRHSAL